MIIDKTIALKSKNKKEFYRRYLSLMNIFMKLTNCEINFAAEIMFLYDFYYQESPEKAENMLMNNKAKALLRNKIGGKDKYVYQTFHTFIERLRKKKFLIGNHINPNIRLVVGEDTQNILFHFKIYE